LELKISIEEKKGGKYVENKLHIKIKNKWKKSPPGFEPIRYAIRPFILLN
jgi:hypothetical protein